MPRWAARRRRFGLRHSFARNLPRHQADCFGYGFARRRLFGYGGYGFAWRWRFWLWRRVDWRPWRFGARRLGPRWFGASRLRRGPERGFGLRRTRRRWTRCVPQW